METTQATFDPIIRENPMGEARKDALKLDFDRRLKLEFHGTKVTSDAGLLAYRELDDALGLTTMTDSELCDNRTGKNTGGRSGFFTKSCTDCLRKKVKTCRSAVYKVNGKYEIMVSGKSQLRI